MNFLTRFLEVLKKILEFLVGSSPPTTIQQPPTPINLKSLGPHTLSVGGKKEIVSFEGVCTAPYRDSGGVWTFGIGHTRFDGAPWPENMAKGVDRPLEEIFKLFADKIKSYEDDVNKAITVPITQEQFDALVSFHYNTGSIDHAALTRAINRGASNETITADFMQWVHDNGRTVFGLVKRRTKEAKLFTDSVYSNNGTATVTTANSLGQEYGARTIDISKYIV